MTCFAVSFVIGMLAAAAAAFVGLEFKWIVISLYAAWAGSWVALQVFGYLLTLGRPADR
jgi:NO-binding membrane sensor protein with MHYT domain